MTASLNAHQIMRTASAKHALFKLNFGRIARVFAAFIISSAALPPSPAFAFQEWQQSLHYNIEAELDTTEKALQGYMTLTYVNHSPETLNSLYFLVPANAFSKEDNTAFREMNRINRSGSMNFSQTRDSELKINTLQFLSIGVETDFALQAFDFSDTILDLPLPVGLAPGDSLKLGMSFTKDYKRRLNRRGRSDIYITFLNWFPRIAAYTKDGWQVEPFHFLMESMDVMSEFASFEVALTVPGQFIVVAPGKNVQGDPGWRAVQAKLELEDSLAAAWHDTLKKALFQQAEKTGVRKTIWQAERTQNFTWTASTNLIYYQKPNDFPVDMIARGAVDRRWEKTIAARLDTLFSMFESYYGKSPFERLVILESRESNLSEPGLAMLPDEDHFTLAQALSSMYMPAMLATNGYKEAWMAKGFGVFLGKKASEFAYGARGYEMEEAQEEMSWWQKRYPLPSFDQVMRNITLLYRDSGQDEAISQKTDDYKDPVGLFANTYMKSSLFYEMLEYVVGEATLQKIMRTFFEQRKFTYVTEKDLQQVSEEVYGQDLDWFFAQWLHGTPTVDYAKKGVKQYQKDDKTWVTEVKLQRNGDGVMPVEVEVEVGGEKLAKRWDGKEKVGKVVFETESKPREIKVDPNNEILDGNMLNNGRARLEFKPDFPFLRMIYMPTDAYLVLWRPRIGYNSIDGLRLGVQTRGGYRSFFNNLDLALDFGFESKTLDGKIAYGHPLRRSNLLNRYRFLARKKEGRYELDARLSFNGSDGIISSNGRGLDFGVNYSGVRNLAYTLRTVASDTGAFKFQEWDDSSILAAYLDANWRRSFGGAVHSELRARAEQALPGGDAQFTKLNAVFKSRLIGKGFLLKVRGNAGTSFGRDDLPLQDSFRAEGASPRERFRHNHVATGRGLGTLSHRYIEGGGNLRGYAGQPMLVNRYLSANFEFGPQRRILALRWFGFYDVGSVSPRDANGSVRMANAGIGATFSGDVSNFFGGNIPIFEGLSSRIYFPLWLNKPLPGEKKTQFRWYFSIGKQF